MIRRRLVRLFWHSDPSGVLVVLALESVAWGLWLLMVGPTFGQQPVYRFLSSVACEEVWGLFSVVFGWATLFVPLLDGRRLFKTVALINVFWWMFLTAGTLAAGTTSTAPAVFGAFALCAGWAFVLER